MVSKEVELLNKLGFHMRPAQLFMEKVNEYNSTVLVSRDGNEKIDASSILGLLTLGIEKGDKFIIEVSGGDEVEALGGLLELVNSKFGED